LIEYIPVKMTAWTDAVSAEFKNGRKTNPKFSLKMAMMKAKKSYKKMSSSSGKTSKKRGGSGSHATMSPADVNNSDHKIIIDPDSRMQRGGKSKKSRKSRKSRK